MHSLMHACMLACVRLMLQPPDWDTHRSNAEALCSCLHALCKRPAVMSMHTVAPQNIVTQIHGPQLIHRSACQHGPTTQQHTKSVLSTPRSSLLSRT